MIKMFVLCLLLSIASKIFSQADTTTPSPAVKTDYLKKSKNQKTAAWVLLGTGTVTMVAGLLMIGNVDRSGLDGLADSAPGAAVFASGLVLDLASIPFFIASAKNKGKSVSASFKNELAPQFRQGSIVQTALPSVGLVIRL